MLTCCFFVCPLQGYTHSTNGDLVNPGILAQQPLSPSPQIASFSPASPTDTTAFQQFHIIIRGCLGNVLIFEYLHLQQFSRKMVFVFQYIINRSAGLSKKHGICITPLECYHTCIESELWINIHFDSEMVITCLKIDDLGLGYRNFINGLIIYYFEHSHFQVTLVIKIKYQ